MEAGALIQKERGKNVGESTTHIRSVHTTVRLAKREAQHIRWARFYKRNRERLLKERQEPERKAHIRRQKHMSYMRNKERILAHVQEYAKANYVAVYERQVRWKAENRERLNQWYRDWYAKHRKERRAYFNAWGRRSPMRLLLYIKWEACSCLCYICGLELAKEEITKDHVIPQAHGGSNEDTNIMPAHKACNSRKNKHLDYPVARPDLIEATCGGAVCM